MSKIVIVGQGGHSKVIRDIISANKSMEIFGYLDDKYEELILEQDLYMGPVKTAKKLLFQFKDIKFVIGVGNNTVRKAMVDRLALADSNYIKLIHPAAVISPTAAIGVGSVVMANAVVNAEAIIGNHTIINTGAIVEHDNIVEDYAHISPNATLTGAVHIEEGVHVGAGANIIPGISIGKWSTIGAGATVIHHIPANCTAVGIPAKLKMKEGEEVVSFNIQ